MSSDNNDNKGKGNNNNNKRPLGGGIFFVIFLLLIGFFAFTWVFRLLNPTTSTEVSYSEFIKMVDEKKVESVVIEDARIVIYPKGSKQEAMKNWLFTGGSQNYYYTGKAEGDETLTNRMLKAGIDVKGEIPSNSSQIWYILLVYVLPTVLFVAFGIYFIRRLSKGGGVGGFMDVGKSNAKVYVEKSTGVTFQDVKGVDEAIESLVEVVDFLHNPDRYVKIGARLPKGVLLVGPPGTGKTLLAKACAGEAHVPFFSLTGSDFVELYVGVGASRVRDLFKEAEKMAPCIIFIDEIDAIGRSRDSKYGGGNEEREQTLNQLLSEMDGFDGNKGIIILAATNRPEILDKALLRPGRFDRRVVVEKPDLKGRVAILKVHAKNVKLDETVNFEEIALATSGATGSDLANMVNEAAINAVKEGRQFVSQKDILNAVEIVLVGKEKKDRILTEQERKIVSYHEVGHALVTTLQKNAEPVQKITIVPRTMGALGYVLQVPEEEKYLNSQEELHDEIVVLLGGRAAEQLVFGSITTGASNDLERATNIARAMVAYYGMSEKFGNVQFQSIESRYLDGRMVMNCADKTAAEIDKEVMSIIKDCYKEAYKMLKKNRDVMDKLAAHLIQKETITGREFMEIYCHEKGIPVPPPKDNSLQFGRDKKEDAQSATSLGTEKSLTGAGKTGLEAAAGSIGNSGTNSSKNTDAVSKSGVLSLDDEDEENYFSSNNETTSYGISKEELEDLNRVVDEELSREQNVQSAPAQTGSENAVFDPYGATPGENIPVAGTEGGMGTTAGSENTGSNNTTAESTGVTGSSEGDAGASKTEEDEFMEILKKRSEGKNDEVE